VRSFDVNTENDFDRVQQPTKFDFSTNLRTAKQLGIEIPPAMLAIADRVIE
jgi:putative ABC transport system substrate-binding protein